MLAQALAAYGVREVVSSPGSRNAPLVVAAGRHPELHVRTVIDERSAAFIALGMASVSREPVALICTSGSALLNYAPAVAEAFYRKVPLIVVSADRPGCWIGQDDSQTLPQPGAFGSLVNISVNLPADILSHEDYWLINRELNRALQASLYGRRGPVHINIPLAEPLGGERDGEPRYRFRKIELTLPDQQLSASRARELAAEIHSKRILIVGGFHAPSARLNRGLARMASLQGTVVAADALANINIPSAINRPDLIDFDNLSTEAARADLLITFGGGLLSKKLKEYLRLTDFPEHWHVGANDELIDSYFSLTRRIEISAEDFFPRLANALAYIAAGENGKSAWSSRTNDGKTAGDTRRKFRETWMAAASDGVKNYSRRMESQGWGELYAVDRLVSGLPADWNLQLGNGLTVRQAMDADSARFHRRDCNRGVSGIDGSVSTAVGASLPYKGTTLLITGDMSMQYDLQALSCNYISPRLKIAVINNSGGGIFRRIASTRSLPELEQRFVTQTNLPLRQIAEAYGFRYLSASGPDELAEAIAVMQEERLRPVLLEAIIPTGTAAEQ